MDGIFYLPSPSSFKITSTNEAVTAPVDTNENILNTYRGTWTVNTVIRWTLDATCTNNANAKNLRVRLGGIGGTIYYQRNMASTTGMTVSGMIVNRGVTDSQEGSVTAGTTHAGVVLGWGKTTSTIDTSVPVDLIVTIEKGTGSDTVVLERFHVERLTG